MKNHLMSTLKLIVLLIALGGARAYADGYDPRKGLTQTCSISNNTHAVIYVREIWNCGPEPIAAVPPGYVGQLEVALSCSQIQVSFGNTFVESARVNVQQGRTNYYVTSDPSIPCIPKIS